MKPRARKKPSAGQLHKIAKLFQQGLDAHRRGDTARARQAYRAILRLQPTHAPALNNLGLLHHAGGEITQAIGCYRRAVAADPGHIDAWINLANALCETGDLEEAAAIADRLGPDSDDVRVVNLAASIAHRRGDLEAAEAGYRRSLRLSPRNPVTLVGLATVLAASDDRKEEARTILKEVLDRDPNFPPALVEYGRLLYDAHTYGEALPILEKAAATTSEGAVLLGFLRLDLGEAEQGLAILERHASKGDGSLASSYAGACNYLPTASQEDLYRAARAWYRRHAEPRRQQGPARPAASRPPLRVGLVSPDLRDHPVGYFIKPLLAHHDRQRIELHCYRIGGVFDDFAQELKNLADGWHSLIDCTDEEAATRIADHHLDILLDLAGHTRGNRLAIFARRPAPLQGAWLGYQSTTGMDEMDFRLTDAIADPPSEGGAGYSERLVHLPGPFFCFEPPAAAPPVARLPAERHGRVTLASINNFCKVNAGVLGCWAEILHRLPDSRLAICCHQVEDPWLRDKIRQFFQERDIDTARITFQGRQPFTDYLSFLTREIDIVLDPFPLCGHTVTCQSLWMGVPVVTLRGTRFGARMGASILTHMGLTELVATSKEDYIAKTVALATDGKRLAELRCGLRDRMRASPLCDAPGFARAFEDTLLAIAAY